ncbi:hypothetical protein [Phycicoccus flavus]|uniref:hypothetical protein n=1 Tax=Phycicoccus flavus TaxID=2502783 RepID=UPI000FEB5E7D|nr:hypothetical protein [Phycicoccus flavus]NHA67827.1 hypothetical protein [Phycicoccus flavus]
MTPVRLLRVLATVLLAVAVGQAGFGSGLVATLVDPPKSEALEAVHEAGAYVVLVTTIACVVAALRVRRGDGPSWPLWFALSLLAAAVLQVTLGSLEVVGAHVFVGVLLLCGVTTYVSYVWRWLADPRGRA